jgi:2-polyprenyl-6-methoxyphenol hydroxylase-like FAD-dependent oxidoreductase
MHAAVRHGLDLGKRVLVVLQPRLHDSVRLTHIEQQQALQQMLTRAFGSEPRFLLVDLSEAVDLRDRNYCVDGMHLSTDGVEREVTMLVAAAGHEFMTGGAAR